MNTKKISSLLVFFGLSLSLLQAQIQSPKSSPTVEIKQTVGLSEIELEYSRPGVKGRTIFGDLVPYGQVWRMGANHCTVIEFDDAVTFAGKEVKAGTYGLFAIPNKDEWTIIISNQNDLWGSAGYDESKDVARVTVKSEKVPHTIETMTIDFNDFKDNGATLAIMFENTAVKIPVTVDTDAVIEEQIKKNLVDGDGKGLEAGDYHSAAVFYQKQGKDLDQALVWMDKSIEMNPTAFYYVYRKAELLKEMGKKKEAIKTAEKSLEMAKANKDGDFGYAAKSEALIKELKAKK